MKEITASEARKRWFRLLDEVATGEVVVLERKGRRIVLRRADSPTDTAERPLPDYKELLRVRDAEHADRWTWEWRGPKQGLTLVEHTVACLTTS